MSDVKDRKASAKTALRRPADIEGPIGIANQPVNNIFWVDPALIRNNDFNPNYVAPPEIRLLRISILTDGWTQPIVVSAVEEDADGCVYEITDGEHRHILGSTDPEIRSLTNGQVPIAITEAKDDATRMMSTIRHNRARGQHHVLSMADIVATLRGHGVEEEEIAKLLQMEREEITRILDRGNMVKRGTGDKDDFNQGWVPK
jgi:ParB-like chromosome segregation protein Spo0J